MRNLQKSLLSASHIMFSSLAAAVRKGIVFCSCVSRADQVATPQNLSDKSSLTACGSVNPTSPASKPVTCSYKHAGCRLSFSKICPKFQLKTAFIKQPIKRCLCFHKYVASVYYLPGTEFVNQFVKILFVFRSPLLGHLVGSVGGVCDSGSRRHEVEPHIRHWGYFLKLKINESPLFWLKIRQSLFF